MKLRTCAIMGPSRQNLSAMPPFLRNRFLPPAAAGILLALILLVSALGVSARDKNGVQYGMGLIVNLPFPESEVAQVVQEVVQNGIIHGTKEYNKDPYITGAAPASSTRVFPEWTEGGKVFYKVRLRALDPRNFKDGSDVGTLAVRYVVQAQGEKSTVLRIDAVFVEDFRHVSHASNGSVESAEYKDIHDQLDAMDAMKVQAAEAQREKLAGTQNNTQLVTVQESPASPAQPAESSLATAVNTSDPVTKPATPSASPQTPEERLRDLKRQVERLVKAPGAPLKSAPFHTATTLQSLAPGTEVLIVITTPYWLGVETHEGQHGWMLRDELEFVP
jgi:hypothetical protein